MELGIIILLCISAIIIIFSFFKKDKVKDLEEQVDQLSLQLLQETYQIKKKLKVLEEELLLEDLSLNKPSDFSTPTPLQNERAKIASLFQNGSDFDSKRNYHE